MLATMPSMQRRGYATTRKVWPEVEVVCACEPVAFRDSLVGIGDDRLVIDTMVGDPQRIIEYPDRSFAVEQHVPDDVHTAYQALGKAGCTSRLIGASPGTQTSDPRVQIVSTVGENTVSTLPGMADQRVCSLVVSGSSAPEGVPELVELFQEDGWRITVLSTPAGTRFHDLDRLAELTGEPVRVDFRRPGTGKSLPPADVVLACPLTFNSTNKFARRLLALLPAGSQTWLLADLYPTATARGRSPPSPPPERDASRYAPPATGTSSSA